MAGNPSLFFPCLLFSELSPLSERLNETGSIGSIRVVSFGKFFAPTNLVDKKVQAKKQIKLRKL